MSQLGTTPATAGVRDAVHVAMISAVCGDEFLSRGQSVGLTNGTASVSPKSIGIVDPFGPEVVKRGQLTWVCLYPNTITDMKHHWEHPEIDAGEKCSSCGVRSPLEGFEKCRLCCSEMSLSILKSCADTLGKTVREFVDELTSYQDCFSPSAWYGILDNSERYKEIDFSWGEVWNAWSEYAGRGVATLGCPYTCAC